MSAWPSGTRVFEGAEWTTVASEDGIRTAYELARLELFGARGELEPFARAAAGLIAEGAVEYVDLSTGADHTDPEDRSKKHALRIHATTFIMREPIWKALWELGARRFRWLVPHWEWDVYRWGVVAGRPSPKLLEKALDALWTDGECDRLVFVEEQRDDALRQVLRGQVEIVSAAASGDDPDRPPSAIETALVSVRGMPSESEEDARRLLKATAHRLLVTAPTAGGKGMVLGEGAEPLGEKTFHLVEGQRAVLAPGDLARDGTVLVLEPKTGLVRWLRVAQA